MTALVRRVKHAREVAKKNRSYKENSFKIIIELAKHYRRLWGIRERMRCVNYDYYSIGHFETKGKK